MSAAVKRMGTAEGEALLQITGAVKTFAPRPSLATLLARLSGRPQPSVRAVDGVTLSILRGEIVALVGESGSGKSTLARIAAGLLPLTAGARQLGSAQATREDAARARAKARNRLRAQMIFQDPLAALNARMRVIDILTEAPLVHGLIKPAQKRAAALEMIDRVGLAEGVLARFPHQLSGGQRARIGIARALAVGPELLVCDEATAALDVSIQAQILNLFLDLKEKLGLTYLFISHDLAVVRSLADRVLIMYLGRIVEEAPCEELFAAPNHPYTRGLLAQALTLDVKKRVFSAVKGEMPSPFAPPSGCHFHPRCPAAMARCKLEDPVLKPVGPARLSACHLNDAT